MPGWSPLLRFGLVCGLLGALGAWIGLKVFPTSAGFIAASGGRALVVWLAFGVLLGLGLLWHGSGVRRSSPLEGICVAFVALFAVGTLALVAFRADPSAGTFLLGLQLSLDLFWKTWWVLILMGLAAHGLRQLPPFRA